MGVVLVVICIGVLAVGAERLRRELLHHGRQFRGFVKPAQHAVARGGIGQMDQLPFSHRDLVASMLADHAGVVFVRAEVLALDGRMEDYPQEFAFAGIPRSYAGMRAESQNEDLLEIETAGERFG